MQILLAGLVSALTLSQPPTPTSRSTAAAALQKVQEAVDWTKESSSNITAAYQAAELWDCLLGQPDDTDEDDATAASNDVETPRMMLPIGIQAMAHLMHASTLIRIGRDEAALNSYDQAIALYDMMPPKLTTTTRQDGTGIKHEGHTSAILGKARSLQRLLRYQSARQLFDQVIQDYGGDNEKNAAVVATVGAATCTLRLGPNLDEALDILQRFIIASRVYEGTKTARVDMNVSIAPSPTSLDLDSPLGLFLVLQFVASQRQGQNFIVGEPKQPLFHVVMPPAFVTVSPVHKWMFHRISRRGYGTRAPHDIPTPPSWPKSTFLDYCKVNVGPLDDFRLRHLDDKVLLHTLLTTATATPAKMLTNLFWPDGVILRASADQELLFPTASADTFTDGTNEDDSTSLWICKRRAGYGSHGNTIIRSTLERIKTRSRQDTAYGNDSNDESFVLVQRMIDSPLLVDGRTFSMRVYIVLCGGCSTIDPQVYIATEGLVKLASVPLLDNETNTPDRSIDPRRYMTNSGREANMSQSTFAFLRQELSESSFATIWQSIASAATNVMSLYHARQADVSEIGSDLPSPLAELGLPKILGFDFVVDQSLKAWLVEINRFPGLEPRNAGSRSCKFDIHDEAAVKHQVVRDAWRVATAAATLNRGSPKVPNDVVDNSLSWLLDDFDDLTEVVTTTTDSGYRLSSNAVRFVAISKYKPPSDDTAVDVAVIIIAGSQAAEKDFCDDDGSYFSDSKQEHVGFTVINDLDIRKWQLVVCFPCNLLTTDC